MDLLERQAQLDELSRRLQDAESGSGKVVFVAGEAAPKPLTTAATSQP
jgi:hypothetical protein